MGTKSTIKFEVDAKSATRMLEQLEKGLKGVEKSVDGVNKKASQSSSSFSSMASSGVSAYKKLGVAIGGAVASIYVLDKAISKSLETSATLERRAISKAWLSHTNAGLASVIDKTEEWTQASLKSYEAVSMVNEASVKGIKLSASSYEQLIKLSNKLALIQGKSTKEVFEGFTVGVARLSPAIQENTGITIKNGQVLDEYAKKHGLVASKLSDETKKMVILNKMIEEGKKKVADLTDVDIEQGLKTYQLYNEYTRKKEKIAEGFFGTLGKKIQELAELQQKANTKEKYEKVALVNFVKKEYSDLYNKLKKQHKDWNDYQIANAIRYSKQGTLSANAWIEAFDKGIAKGVKELKDKDTVELKIKLARNTFTHLKRDFYRGWVDTFPQFDPKKLEGNLVLNILIGNVDKAKDIVNQNNQKIADENKKWWDEHKSEIMSRRKKLADNIISYQKELDNYSNKSNEEKLKLDRKYSAEKLKLARKRVSELKKLEMKTAIKVDTKIEGDLNNEKLKQAKEEAINQIIELDKKKRDFTKLSRAEQLRLEAEYTNDKKFYMQMDLEGLRNYVTEEALALDRQTRIHKKYIATMKALNKDMLKDRSHYVSTKKRIDADMRKHDDIISKENEKALSITRDVTMSVLNAIIEGNASAIPKILAQKAMLYGTDTFWKGITDIAMAKGFIANPITTISGAQLLEAGINEMLIGSGLMALGGVASATLGSGGASADSGKSASSGDRLDNKNNLNQSKQSTIVTSVYEYPSEREKLKRLREQNKRIRKGGL